MWSVSTLKTNAKAAFKHSYWSSVLVALVLAVVVGGTMKCVSGDSSAFDMSKITQMGISVNEFYGILAGASAVGIIIGLLVNIFITNMLEVGGYRYFVNNSRFGKGELSDLISAYKDKAFGNIFVTMFLTDLFLILWFCLLIVPGIIHAYAYRMVPYILADDPHMAPMDAIKLSKQMMKGHKWHAFVLDLSFIGWDILSAITCGIVAIFWRNPYKNAADAELYLTLKNLAD